jgi:BASS family bile acid:Na+ symporter
MLSMGITLTPEDFAEVAKRPIPIIIQFALCYGVMPLLALGLGKAFKLDPSLMAGMVLVGSINGGQASNLCTYIANGNVALSVLMTTATTLGAIVATPLICKTLLGTVVPIDAAGIAMSTCQVVLAPIFVGMAANKLIPNVVKKIVPFAPLVGILSTCFLVASAVAQVSGPILEAGIGLQIPIMLLHLLGGILGYAMPKMLGFSETESRTMAIETSMKSSAFGFLLAKLHFGSYAARVPSAVSVVWMALTGSILAVVWRYIPIKDGSQPKK